jgi:AraC-like DNA-binding protein/quercetin dioxygenase-like cupin family protein
VFFKWRRVWFAPGREGAGLAQQLLVAIPESLSVFVAPRMFEKFNLPKGTQGAVWFYRARQTSVWPMHKHSELELNLVISGRASYILGDRRYELRADDLVWLFPAQEHQLIDRSPDYEMWVVVFTPQALKAAVRNSPAAILTERDPAGRFCKSLAHGDMLSLTQFCAELFRNSEHVDILNAGLRYLVLRSWERFAANAGMPHYQTLHPAVENALQMLRRGESDESLGRLSLRAGLSPARLSRRFKTEVGLGIAEYRNRLRLERFIERYGSGNRLTALAAAYEAGFHSYAQFHRVFSRLMGYGPAEHRRRMQHRA